MHACNAIFCSPGYRAKLVEVVPEKTFLERVVGGPLVAEHSFENGELVLLCHEANKKTRQLFEKELVPNRAFPYDEDTPPLHFYYGRILILATEKDSRGHGRFRNLTLKEVNEVLEHFEYPDFPRPIILGLSPGEELEIISGIDFEGKPPEHVVVVREREFFITVRLFFHGWDTARSYVTTLNKNSILCGDVLVERKATMEDLRSAMLSGGAMNPADFVSVG